MNNLINNNLTPNNFMNNMPDMVGNNLNPNMQSMPSNFMSNNTGNVQNQTQNSNPPVQEPNVIIQNTNMNNVMKEEVKNEKISIVNPFLDFNLGNIVKGLGIIFLLISASFLGESLGCQIQKILANNIYAKHLLIFISIYFSIDMFSNKSRNPLLDIRDTVLIWVLFLFFTKMHLSMTIAALCMLIIARIVSKYEQYLIDNNKSVDNIKQIKNSFLVITVVLIIIGFSLYSVKQYREHYENFSVVKLLLGVVKCGYLDEL